MECPKCRRRAAFEAQEACDGCGLVFSAWKPGGGATPSAATVAISAVRPAEKSGVPRDTLRLLGLLLSLLPVYFIQAKIARWVEARPAMGTNPEEAGGSVKNPCILAGEVLDVYRLTPVVGARIAFDPKFAGVTDGGGMFKVKVTAGTAYAPQFVHNDYLPVHIDGFARDWREASPAERATAARIAEARSGQVEGMARTKDYKCAAGETETYNFALVPTNLSAEERAQYAGPP